MDSRQVSSVSWMSVNHEEVTLHAHTDGPLPSANQVDIILFNDVGLSSSSSSPDDAKYDKLMSDELERLLELIFVVILCGVIATLGSVANVINIIIFCKQGFSETVNISLLGLAVSDLGALLTLIWISIHVFPLFWYSDTFLGTLNTQYLMAGWPHVCFTRITSWITAFVTFERCICIALPLRVKDIITVRRTVVVIVAIFVVMFFCVSPVFYAIRIAPAFFPEYNTTLYGLIYVRDGVLIETVVFNLNIVSQLISFIIVIICTFILIYSLCQKSKWRLQAASASASGPKNAVSRRQKKVVKMVLFISIVFIAGYLPSVGNWVLMTVFAPEYGVAGRYANTFSVTWGIINMLAAINSSINIIIYLKMSSRYRAVFMVMFCRRRLGNGSDPVNKSEDA